ncbi:MAG: type VI secretion system contractile sheath small subunit [Deltaproteobacteria bacterium]|nr:type VI secretion system contractile sheath small subunit [Deltaproteobacteria bacterium]
MAGSFQNEIPPSRVNIRYVKDTGGATEEIELPLKLLVMGDFNLKEDDTPLEERERVNIDSNSFSSVLQEQKLELDMVVPNTLAGDGEMPVNLKINSLNDFTPTGVANQIPELSVMLEVRNLLTDLKAKVVSNREFRKQLEDILKDKGKMDSIIAELDKIAPLNDDGAE